MTSIRRTKEKEGGKRRGGKWRREGMGCEGVFPNWGDLSVRLKSLKGQRRGEDDYLRGGWERLAQEKRGRKKETLGTRNSH